MMNQEAEGRFLCYLRGRPQAEARLQGGAEHAGIRGTVRFYGTPLGVLVAAAVRGLPHEGDPCAGGFFALHIHERGACTGSPEFADAGGHYNPRGCPHPGHAGDLPPLLEGRGFAWSVVLTARFAVAEILGRAVILHAGPDDFTSQPAGNAGARMACGVITAVAPDTPWPDPCSPDLLPPEEANPWMEGGAMPAEEPPAASGEEPEAEATEQAPPVPQEELPPVPTLPPVTEPPVPPTVPRQGMPPRDGEIMPPDGYFPRTGQGMEQRPWNDAPGRQGEMRGDSMRPTPPAPPVTEPPVPPTVPRQGMPPRDGEIMPPDGYFPRTGQGMEQRPWPGEEEVHSDRVFPRGKR